MPTPPIPTDPDSPGCITLENEPYSLVAKTGLGFLGTRWLAECGTKKRYLVRNVSWAGVGPAEFGLRYHEKIFRVRPAGQTWFLLPRMILTSVSRPGEKDSEPLNVFLQDVSDLAPLSNTVAGLASEGKVAEVHRLLSAAATALGEYQAATDPAFIPESGEESSEAPLSGPPVLCPAGIAVASDGTVVLLDAGLTFLRHPKLVQLSPPGLDLFFTQKERERLLPGLRAKPEELSYLQAVGLLQLFARLARTNSQSPGMNRKEFEITLKEVTQRQEELKRAKKPLGIEDVQKVFAARAGMIADITSDPEPLSPPPPPNVIMQVPQTPPQEETPILETTTSVPPYEIVKDTTINDKTEEPKKEHVVWKILTAVFALAAVILGIALLTRGARVSDVKNEQPPGIASLAVTPVPVHYVLFIRDNADLGEVEGQIKAAIPEADIQGFPRRGQSDREKLVDDKLVAIIAGITDPQPVNDVLTKLQGANVRFNGFNPSDRDSLRKVVRNQGVFTYPNPDTKAPDTDTNGHQLSGGLLQPDGPRTALTSAKLTDDPKSVEVLATLQKLVIEFAAFNDLVSLIGENQAVVVTPKGQDAQTPQRFAEIHAKLIKTDNKTVFAPRPGLGLYAAVDYKVEEITPPGSYMLKIPARTFWRLAGSSDRTNVDFTKTSLPVKEKMKWRSVESGERIVWQQATLAVMAGRPKQVTSFDVAIPVPVQGKVAVFRNQTIEMDPTQDAVRARVEAYLRDVLKVPANKIGEGYATSAVGDQWIGTIQYSSLAPMLATTGTASGGDIEILSQSDFNAIMTKDNDTVGK